MKYFFLKNSAKKEEIGNVYPQCEGMAEGYTHKRFEQPNSMTKLTNDSFPGQDPDLLFDLNKKGILTDVVSPSNLSAKGLLVNQRTKHILDEFDLMPHKYYPATIREKGISYDYFWLHLVKKDLSGIDFQESEFEITNLVYMPISDIEISDFEDYMEKAKSLSMKHIRAKKIVLDKTIKTDLIYFRYISSDILISENLAIELAKSNITGIEIVEQQSNQNPLLDIL